MQNFIEGWHENGFLQISQNDGSEDFFGDQ